MIKIKTGGRLTLGGKIFLLGGDTHCLSISCLGSSTGTRDMVHTKIESEHTRIVSELSRNYNLIEETTEELESLKRLVVC